MDDAGEGEEIEWALRGQLNATQPLLYAEPT